MIAYTSAMMAGSQPKLRQRRRHRVRKSQTISERGAYACTIAIAAIAGRLAMIRAHGNLGDPSVALKVLDLEPCNRALPLAWCKTCGNPSDFDGRCACWCNLAGALQQYLGLDHDGSAQLAADLWDQLAERERVWSAAYAHDHDVEVYPDTRGFA